MRTVAQLIAAGFIVRDSLDGLNCTEVASDKPFWFYNPRWLRSNDESGSRAREVLASLRSATLGPTCYQLVVAGVFEGDTEFPFEIIDSERKELLEQAFTRYQEHSNLADRALDDFHDALRVEEPYTA